MVHSIGMWALPSSHNDDSGLTYTFFTMATMSIHKTGGPNYWMNIDMDIDMEYSIIVINFHECGKKYIRHISDN